MIEAKNLTKVYGDGTKALDSLTFSSSSKSLTLLGKNGAGKTTFMRILSTQLMPTSGSALVEGYDVVKDAKKVRKIVSSIPQEAKPVGISSPYEHVAMYLTSRGLSISEAISRSRSVLKDVGLWEVKDKPTDSLSGGMKRKVFVAMALASDAEVVFLDEPTTGLDPLSRMEVWSILKSMESKLVLTTHYMEEAQELADELLMINRGKLVMSGSPSSLLKKFEGMVRVEGTGEIRVGRTMIKYVRKDEASYYVGKYIIKPISLEDLFIMYAGDQELTYDSS
ncbi:ABC transporter ATP-binding protein [Sulfuracidifex tepidarius]|uniref:Trehalose/maltose import ATP-binding protein MalK n=1 Tax=Sulfuracidifex tepidarius TaxID=1294262 RepID=A0A510E6S5_9CREN|nr:ABC transporter ATP-binding protein [Sulfuracidifex tepidarius]BBG25438.1 Trehalose/maltose import ATP-binding protein MalK [Sulfuracidifex tepidarius]BBG28232.1 Trehalose/maltose import ATP-binding protein MalK [Sulfuracidifex tepidarius]